VARFWGALAVRLGKHAGLVSAVALLVTLILGFGITKLDFATGQDSYLNADEEVYKDNVAYQDLFGGQVMVVLFSMEDGTSVAELTSPENQRVLREAEAELLANPHVETVVSPLTALQFTDNLVQRAYDDPSNPEPAADPTTTVAATILSRAIAEEAEGSPERAAREADFAATAERLLSVQGPKDLTNPDWVDFLLHGNDGEIRKPLRPFFFDERHAQFAVRLVGNADIDAEGLGAVAVQEAWEDRELEGAEVTVTGAPVLLKDINDYLRGGMLTLGAIAVAIMMVILLVDVRWRLLPLLIILIGVVWAFGLAGYLGIPLSLVTIAGLPVMLGVGIDYAIQMHARVEEEVVIDRDPHPIQETARNLGPALLVVTLDAVLAFAALYFAEVPMIRQFGLLLAVGIAAICLCSIVMPLAILGIREYKSPTKGRDFREGPLGRFVVRIGGAPKRFAPWFAAASVLIFFGGIVVEGKLVLQTDPVEWVNQESKGIKDLERLEEETKVSSELGVFVRSDEPFSDEQAAFLHGFTNEQLDRHDDLLRLATSIVTPISFLTELEGASEVVPTGEEMRAVYEAAPEPIQRSTINDDGRSANLIFLTRPASLELRKVMVDDMRAVEDPPGVDATPSGLAVVGVGLLENLEANRVLLTYLAIGFVFLYLAARLRSVVRALLSLVPVLIAVGTASLVAYVLDLKLSPMTAVGGPLVVAA
jgi:uncharacterized protein